MVRTENEEADEPRAAAAADALERDTHSSPHEGTASQESCRRPPAERFVVSHTRLYTIHAGARRLLSAPHGGQLLALLPVASRLRRRPPLRAQRSNSFSGIKSAALVRVKGPVKTSPPLLLFSHKWLSQSQHPLLTAT